MCNPNLFLTNTCVPLTNKHLCTPNLFLTNTCIPLTCVTVTNYRQKDNNLAYVSKHNLFNWTQRETTELELITTLNIISLLLTRYFSSLISNLTTDKVLSFSLVLYTEMSWGFLSQYRTPQKPSWQQNVRIAHEREALHLSLVTWHAKSLVNNNLGTKFRIITTIWTESCLYSYLKRV